MSEPLLDITVSDGKYRIIQQAGGGTVALRYGEDWLNVTTTPGSNMILAMAYELEELRAKVGKLTEEQYLLVSLAEEGAEVIHRVTKALRFGMDEVCPTQELTNAQRITGELNDFEALRGRLVVNGSIPPLSADAVSEKHVKVDRYMDYAREQGTLA